jgi:hypothetical protein
MISRCRRCDELRQQILMVRVPAGPIAAWQCPECAVAWTPVTFANTLWTPAKHALNSISLPKLCPCPAGGPFTFVERVRRPRVPLWLCAGCGAGQIPKIA